MGGLNGDDPRSSPSVLVELALRFHTYQTAAADDGEAGRAKHNKGSDAGRRQARLRNARQRAAHAGDIAAQDGLAFSTAAAGGARPRLARRPTGPSEISAWLKLVCRRSRWKRD